MKQQNAQNLKFQRDQEFRDLQSPSERLQPGNPMVRSTK
jgi:hypothetical protein